MVELPGVVRAQQPTHDARPVVRKESYKIMYPLDEHTLAGPQPILDAWKETQFKDKLDEIIKRHNEKFNVKGLVHKFMKRGAEAADEAVMEESTVKIEPQAGDPTTEAEIDAKYPGTLKVSCGCGATRWTAIITSGPGNGSEFYLIGEDVVVPSGVLCLWSWIRHLEE